MINILMAASDNMYDGLELVICSTMAHNKNVHFYIMTMNIHLQMVNGYGNFHRLSEEHISELRKIIKYYDKNSDLSIIYTEEPYVKNLENNINENNIFTPFANLRLLADILLPNIDHCLYFDCDISVQSDLSEMYKYYTSQDCNYAAYTIPQACDYAGEMVSGVLVLNLNKIRETGFLKKARRNLFENEYKFPDQMALRDSDTPFPMQETYSYMFDLNKCHYTPAIIHYTDELYPKVYDCGKKVIFYRKFPFLQYVQDTVNLLKNIDIHY